MWLQVMEGFKICYMFSSFLFQRKLSIVSVAEPETPMDTSANGDGDAVTSEKKKKKKKHKKNEDEPLEATPAEAESAPVEVINESCL